MEYMYNTNSVFVILQKPQHHLQLLQFPQAPKAQIYLLKKLLHQLPHSHLKYHLTMVSSTRWQNA